MSILRPLASVIVLLSVCTAALPAAAQFYPRKGGYGQPSSVIIGDRVQIGVPSSVIVEGRGYYNQPYSLYPQTDYRSSPSVIFYPSQPYYFPQSSCSNSVIGSPIPLPYARDSVTGAICH
jgi:hypothetical protein